MSRSIAGETEQAAGLRAGRRFLDVALGYIRRFAPESLGDKQKEAEAQGQVVMQALQIAFNTDRNEQMPSLLYGVGFAIGTLGGQMGAHNRAALLDALRLGLENGFDAANDVWRAPVGHA